MVDLEIDHNNNIKTRTIAKTVIDHDPLHDHAVGGEPGHDSTKKPHTNNNFLIVEDLDVDEATGVIDGNMDVLPAGTTKNLVATITTINGQTRPAKLTKLLNINVNKLAQMAPTIPIQRLQ